MEILEDSGLYTPGSINVLEHTPLPLLARDPPVLGVHVGNGQMALSCKPVVVQAGPHRELTQCVL